ncbi:DinB family protein [Bacillus massilinigeriensis]|uniref:DinB family protein n=1 Tax=Bacillus massilionigeriensis TaxID=1805475 RepID=UPI000A59DE70
MGRPEEHEYSAYFSKYINSIPDGDIIQILQQHSEEMNQFLNKFSEEQALFKYAEDKWSIKEVVGHVIDTERIMAYRLLCIARGETVSLPGFNENTYVQNADFNRYTIQELREDFAVVRKATLQLLKRLEPKAWLREGTANNSLVTARAIAYIIAGHELHHRNIISNRYMQSDMFPLI